MTTRFYDAVGLPVPGVREDDDTRRITVPTADLDRLRGRLLAVGARVQQESPTSLSFRDPTGVHVELVADSSGRPQESADF